MPLHSSAGVPAGPRLAADLGREGGDAREKCLDSGCKRSGKEGSLLCPEFSSAPKKLWGEGCGVAWAVGLLPASVYSERL